MRTHSTSGAEASAGNGQAAQQSLSAMRDALGANSSAFWSNQEKALDAMQEYSNGMQHFAKSWFARRHEGANAALQASQRMLTAQNPADALWNTRNGLRARWSARWPTPGRCRTRSPIWLRTHKSVATSGKIDKPERT